MTMSDSPAVVILGGSVITTEDLEGEWMMWEAAFGRLRRGSVEQVVVFDGGAPGPVFAVYGGGADRLQLAGGLPAVRVRCENPGDLRAGHGFEERLRSEGVERVHGVEVWRRDPVEGLSALVEVKSR